MLNSERCLICNRKLDLNVTQIVIMQGKHAYKSVCCSHEGTEELKKILDEKFDVCEEAACIGECGVKCDIWINEKLSLVNSLLSKVEDIDCSDGICFSVMARVDDEVRKVFKEFGIYEEEFNKNVDNNRIDLNIIGFIYGKWFDSGEGYLDYEM